MILLGELIMKKIFLIISILTIITPTIAFADVVHIPLDEAVNLALENNLDLKSKRKQAEELKQEIKRLQSAYENSSNNMENTRSISNVDLLKRISQLEKIVYGNNE